MRKIIAYRVRVAAQLECPCWSGELFGMVFLASEPVSVNDLTARLGIIPGGAGQELKALAV